MTEAEKYAMIILDCKKQDLKEQMESYYYNFCDGIDCGHGFIFTDGSALDICEDDHRTLSIKLWNQNQITTIHRDNRERDIFVRIHQGLTMQQIYKLTEITSIGFNLIVDFYDEKDNLKESCNVDYCEASRILNNYYKGV